MTAERRRYQYVRHEEHETDEAGRDLFVRNVAASMEFDEERTRLAPTASMLRARQVAEIARLNGR